MLLLIFATPTYITALSSEQRSRILVSIIIPAFNEEKNVGNVLLELHQFVKRVKLNCEIIVVDDGSTDKTNETASRNGAKVLSNNSNQGKGCSLRSGFEYAKGEIIVTLDGDGAHNPNDIEKLILPVMNGTDFVIGSRFNSEEGRKTTTQVNLIGNHLISLGIRILTGNVVTDSQSGFRAYNSKVLKEILVTSKGFDIETELTLKPIIRGYSLKEVPIFIRKRANGNSRLNPIRDGFKILKIILMAILYD